MTSDFITLKYFVKVHLKLNGIFEFKFCCFFCDILATTMPDEQSPVFYSDTEIINH